MSAMTFRAAPAAEGATWVKDAFAAFARQPLGFAALFAFCALASLVLASIPTVGWVVLVVAWPAASLLFMIATERGAGGGIRQTMGAFAALAKRRDRLTELFKLGVCYLVAGVLTSWVVGWLDGGAFAAFLDAASNAQTVPDAMADRLVDPAVRYSFLLRMTATALLSIPFWHAPALVFWGEQSWAQSIFFSTVALWRNRAAFLVYGLVWSAIGIGFSFALGLAVGLAGPATGVALAAPLMMIFWTVMYASLWFTFVGCFDLSPTPTPALETNAP